MDVTHLATEWNTLMAPVSGDIRTDLVHEAAEYLGIPIAESWDRLRGAGERFREEWLTLVGDSTDDAVITEFYNRSDTELFELIEWHATDPIHYRTLIIRDIALTRPGRSYLDYGSGIGSDAIVFADAGFDITLADVSDILLGFAAFRCRKRGASVRTINVKSEVLPRDAFDAAVCFDVLEHIRKPLPVVRRIARSLRLGGLFAIHAPFGKDPEHPMHVAHRDVVTPRIRAIGFRPMDLNFPPAVRPPLLYQKAALPLRDRAAYFVYDMYLRNRAGDQLAEWYKRMFARTPAVDA